MSEHPFGARPILTETQPRPAAVIALVRPSPAAGPVSLTTPFEVFVVRRARELRQFGGFVALVGGGVDSADAGGDAQAALVACAARELFEEAGVLAVTGAAAVPRSVRDDARRTLVQRGADAAGFGRFLAQQGLAVDGARFHPAGRWVTPRFVPVRFDAHFFVVEVNPADEAEVWPGELASGEWIDPARLVKSWEEGAVLLHPPQSHLAQSLAAWNASRVAGALATGEAGLDGLCRRIASGGHRDADQVATRVDFQRGVIFFPVLTPTLPPAQHTNCYVVGTGDVVVVDPGSPYADEQARLHRLLDELGAEGKTPKGVVVTHHHEDHVGGALATARHLGVPLFGHPRALDRVPADASVSRRELADGERIDLDGPLPMQLHAVFTPGHARGHFCFHDDRSGAILCGDMISTLSTIIIDPPEGDLGDYLASLERLRTLAPRTLYPSHGLPTQHAVEKIDEYLSHRRARAEALAAALAAGPRDLMDLVTEVYADVPPIAHLLAARSAVASLEWLARGGRVRPVGPASDPAARWQSA